MQSAYEVFRRTASLGLILALSLYLSLSLATGQENIHGNSTFEEIVNAVDLRHVPLSNSQNSTENNAKVDEPRTNSTSPFLFDFHPRFPNLALLKEKTSTGKPASAVLINASQSLPEQYEHEDGSDLDLVAFPKKFLRTTFQKGESEWLTREKRIESLWLHNEGADPRSSLGTAFAFNAPNAESLLLSNTSVLLEFASKAFMQEINDATSGKVDTDDALLRRKRFTNFLFDTHNNIEPLAKVDISPFIPAHEYTKCGVNEELARCDAAQRYRTYSGWCNNLRQPSWGKSVVAFDRMLPPAYDDGISRPKQRSVTGRALPSPRYISSMVHVDVSHLSQRHTLMFMQYAQFLDHDITLTPVNKGPRDSILNCRDCDSSRTQHPECWPIPVPSSDSYYPAQAAAAQGKGYCIPFTRSLAGQQRLGPRDQINQNSAYLDSSQIYGENYCKGMSLRGIRGTLNVTVNAATGGKVLMPQVTQMRECRSSSGYCFYAGDNRASEQPGLTSVHTIFLREHNRISDNLQRVNPHWTDDKLYQETRRILNAMGQHVAYSEFLPRLIGATRMNAYGIQLQNDGYFTGYDANCAATAYNEFATAAFRFGHSLIRPTLARMDNQYNGMNPHIPLRDGFFNPDMLYKSLMVDEILRGLLAEPMEQMDPFITKEITNHLFEDTKRSFSGMDLIALNLHRGRDHGLQGYNAYRAACGLTRAKTFQELQSEIPTDVITRLQHVYEHVDDIDLFTGSVVERPVSGGILGPTMSCIIGNQFKRLRKCDRFWYETNDPLLKFSPLQLAEIRKTTLSKIICENFDTPSEIQKAAFDAPHNFLNPRLPCDKLPTLNFEAWRESPSTASGNNARGCKIGSKLVGVGGSGLSSPCVSCICTPEGTKCASLRITSCARLSLEAKREDIMKDSVCTSQCATWLGIRSTHATISQYSGTDYSLHNDHRLQVLQPPAPYPSNQKPVKTSASKDLVNNLFNIINGRSRR